MNHREIFLNNVAQTSDFPLALEIEKAEGIYLYGKGGEKYIDLISGIGVSNVGHRHPGVLKAISTQLEKYMHLMVYGEYIQQPQVLLANALVGTLERYKTDAGYRLDNVYFTNSGTEAVEGAMKLAKRYTGRHEIISFTKSYHGSTQGALSLGEEHFRRNFRPLLPAIRKIERNKLEDLQQITKHTAAVIFEPVGGESGVRPADEIYIRHLRARCTETGTLLVFDEVQSGFGRTGSFWAFEQYGIVPDVLLCAKGMGGGMPIGAFIAPHEIMAVFKDNPILGHITTFGGHPVSCAASLATLETIIGKNLTAEVERKAELFRQYLVHPLIKEIRNKGLMMAVEFETFDILKAIIDKAISKGVITDWFLYCDNSMRIAPPLIITEDEIRQACDVILDSINETAQALS